ncbi:MAG: methyltransferase domain-containing protein [Alphaproteobacteria bacterium]|nr:methyltransferase domain-containing protein [Alphaproteobacteria bacterium]
MVALDKILRQKNEHTVFDRTLIKKRRERALKTLSNHSFLYEWASEQIQDRLSDLNRSFPLCVQIGSRGIIKTHEKIQKSIVTDLTSKPFQKTALYIQAEEEVFPFQNKSLDLVTSILNLHTVNDLPGTLIQIQNTLKPDGLFLACLFGGETLYELRHVFQETEIDMLGGVSPRIYPFADKPQMGDLMQRARFGLPVIDSEIITVTYDNLFKLLDDLRGMGESNTISARHKTPLNQDFFIRAAERYQKSFAEADGKIRASFEIIFVAGWAPHQSQQKPLRPGSAQHSLAEALGTDEIKTGEKASP